MIRRTESRLPFKLSPKILGESESHERADGKEYHLVSYLTSPISRGATNDYVLFGVNGAPEPIKYEWKAEADDDSGIRIASGETEIGCWRVTMPKGPDTLKKIKVKCKLVFEDIGLGDGLGSGEGGITVDGTLGGVELTLKQKLRGNWKALDTLCDCPPAPFALHPETAREVIENFSGYIETAALVGKFTTIVKDKDAKDEQAGSGDKEKDKEKEKEASSKLIPAALLAAIVYRDALLRPAAYDYGQPAMLLAMRDKEANRVIKDLNSADWAKRSLLLYSSKVGVCGLSMGSLLLLHEELCNSTVESQIANSAGNQAFDKNDKYRSVYRQMLGSGGNESSARGIDMFNLLRFPKTNILLCAMMLNSIKKAGSATADVKGFDLLMRKNAVEYLADGYDSYPEPSEKSPGDTKFSNYAQSIWSLCRSPLIQSFFTASHDSYDLVHGVGDGQAIAEAKFGHFDKLGKILSNMNGTPVLFNITAMQAALHRFGVLASEEIDGYFRESTMNAVSSFQDEIVRAASEGFNNGVVNKATAEKLRECAKKDATSKDLYK